MIIVGGFKVFSGKVEDTLAKHPAVGMIDKKVLRKKT
jgi:hypothetical protein